MNNPPSAPRYPALLILAAWVFPGLGHILAGHVRRGLILAATILCLFTAGLLIGGIDAVDRRNDTLWFSLGQVHIGPLAFAVSELHAYFDRTSPPMPRDPADPDADAQPPSYRHSLARVNEIGTLYCAVAGGLNLLVILDLLGRLSSAPLSPQPAPTRGRLVTRDHTS